MRPDLRQQIYHTECGGFFESLGEARRHQQGCFCEKIVKVDRYEDIHHSSLLMQMQKWEMDQLAWEEPLEPVNQFGTLYVDCPRLW